MTARTRRLLIVSPHFPPDASAGAHRARVLAPYLADHGWQPTVLTVQPSAYEGCLDRELADAFGDRATVVRVPAAPAGATRRVGVGDLGLRAFLPLYRAAASTPADAVFLTTYPVYPAAFGPRLARALGARLVVDLQDPWVGEWGRTVGAGPDGAPDWKSRISRTAAARLERFVLPRADALTSVSSTLLEELAGRYPAVAARPRLTLPVGIDPRDVDWVVRHPRDVASAPRPDGRIHVCYVGTMLPLGYETLDLVFEAVAHTRRVSPGGGRLCLHFVGTSNQADPASARRVMPGAIAAGLADVVHEVPGRIPFHDALRVLMRASIVLLMGTTEARYTASKLQAALASGRPIIALVHDASDVARSLRPLASRDAAIRLLTYDEQRPASTLVPDLSALLQAWCDRLPERREDTRYAPGTTGPELASALASLLESLEARRA